MIDLIEEETSTKVRLHLLTATTKLFFTRPAECQDMLGKLMEYAIGESLLTGLVGRGFVDAQTVSLSIKTRQFHF